MAFIIKDRVKEGTISTGTGAIELNGPSSTFAPFNSFMVDGDTTYYAIVHTTSGVDEWEVGLGTWNTGNTITRTTILSGSNGTSAVDFSDGIKDVFMTYPASVASYTDGSGDLSSDIGLGNHSTTELVEGSNLYYLDSRVDAHLSGGTGVTYTSGVISIGQDVSTTSNVTFNSIVSTDGVTVGGNLAVSGDLVVSGTTTTINATELAIQDNMIYLNEGSTITNPDLGWVGNYNDGTYAHSGVFRDATDSTFKFFDGYTPEPGQAIDVTHASYNDADIKFGTAFGDITGNVTGDLTGNVTGNLTGNSSGMHTGSVVGNVTGNSSTATKLATARTVQLSGDVTGSATFDGSANINITAAVQDDSHSHVVSNVDGLQTALDSKAPTARIITAGTGITGGGDLTVNRTISLDTAYTDGRYVNASGDTMTGLLYINTDRVFADNYHPNADKWTTAKTLSLSGDASGSVSWDGSDNATLSVAVADDSHNHIISNVDGLQTALDGKLSTSGKAADSNLLDGLQLSSVRRGVEATPLTLADDLDTITTNGHYRWAGGAPTNAPSGTYHNMMVLTDGVQPTQMVWGGSGSGTADIHIRRRDSGSWQPWTTFWNSGNSEAFTSADHTKLDGIETGATADQTAAQLLAAIKTVDVNGTAGINAGTFDGLDSSKYLRSDGFDQFSGLTGTDLTVTGSATVSNTGPLIKLNDTTSGAHDFFLHANNNSFYVLTDRDGNGSHESPHPLQLVNSTSQGYIFGGKVWTSANDGAGSGLDADSLDGLSEASFMRRSANSQLNMNNNDIIGVDQIFHHGDTNTYIQFHAADQFRVVTGGAERLEVNNITTQISQDLTLTATGTTATSTRKLSVQSSGYAVLELSSDRLNTTGEPGGAGMTMGVDGTNPNGVVSFVNAAGTNGVGGSYTGTSANVMLVGTLTPQDLVFGRDGNVELVLGSTAFRPNSNGTRDLGNTNYRWEQLFAATTTIATSDATTKQDVEEISEAEARVALVCKGLMRKFRFIDAVEKKGDDARIHFGIMAQDLQAAFADEGLDAGRYAMFCSDTWFEEDIVIPARDAVEEVLDDEGNVTTEARDAVAETTQRKVYEDGEEVPDTATEITQLGVRYSELLAFIIAAI